MGFACTARGQILDVTRVDAEFDEHVLRTLCQTNRVAGASSVVTLRRDIGGFD